MNSHTLPTGYRLFDTYEIRGALDHGISSVTYAAVEGPRRVRVEEYFPARLATRPDGVAVAVGNDPDQIEFDAGLAAFLTTGRALARIERENVVHVRHWAAANGTGYIVTDDLDGETLAARLDREQVVDDDDIEGLVAPILDGLEAIHLVGILHRQISPAAIVIRRDGKAVLTGFGLGAKVAGGARQVFDPRAASRANIVPGYSALEQYSSNGREGAWTDIYAFGAVLYRCVTGQVPDDAPFRTVRQNTVSARDAGAGRNPRLLGAIDAALALPVVARPQSVPVWRALLFDVEHETSLASRAGRTSARGFGRAPTPSLVAGGGASSADVQTLGPATQGTVGQRTVRWATPALAAVGMIVVMTWVDTGVLRGNKAGAAASDAGGHAEFGPLGDGEFADALRVGGRGPAMVRVEPGRLTADCWREDCGEASERREVVFARSFALSKYEVSAAEYARFLAATGRSPAGGQPREPAVNVSWDDAVAYTDWLSAETDRDYRLPSEAEWVYAAHAGVAASRVDGVAAVADAADSPGPAPVGQGTANAWGLHDMAANVAEWVFDCAAFGPDGLPGDGSAVVVEGCANHIRRGSSWTQPVPNIGVALRAASATGFRALDTGFRVAVDVEEG